MAIRPVREADLSAIMALEAEVFGADAWSEQTVAAELGGADRVGLVATDRVDGDVVGYAAVMLTVEVADLNRIAVAAPWRRQGVGVELLERVVTEVAAHGCARLLLEVSEANDAAIAFYRDAGFAELARRARYYRDGSDAVVLGLLLES